MIDHFFFLVLPLCLCYNDAIFADFQQAAFYFGSFLQDEFYQPADVLFILPVQFQRFIQTGGRDFQGKIVGGNDARFFQLFVQCPVNLYTFFDGDALIAVDEHFNIIHGLDPNVHQEILRFASQNGLDQTFYRLDCFGAHLSE